MSTKLHQRWGWFVFLGLFVTLLSAATGRAGITTLYSTQFEAAEGYNANLDLIGQNGWTGSGSGGNGLVTNYFPGVGGLQQAYIGYNPPLPNEVFLSTWRAINLAPVPTNTPIVKFSVLLGIYGSDNGERDDFYWSVYNSHGDRLFTLDFDNYYLNVYYGLDGTNKLVTTGRTFTNNIPYTLLITMNYAQNQWSATLGGVGLVTNKPITTVGAPLNLGDIDAVWSVFTTNAPGNNYMVFDNYLVTAETVSIPPAKLATLGRTADNQFLLRLTGPSGYRYAIEATTNLVNWVALKTNVVSDGSFDYVDTTAPNFPRRRYYRARLVP
jgi:hypothetical protein